MSVAITAYGVTCNACFRPQGTSGFSSLFNVLTWLLALGCIYGFRPQEANAAKQNGARKEISTAKATPAKEPFSMFTRRANTMLHLPLMRPITGLDTTKPAFGWSRSC